MNLYQEDKRLIPEIRQSGCYLLSLHFHISVLGNIDFTYFDINKYYYKFLSNGYIEKNCYILRPDRIFSFFDIDVSARKEPAHYPTKENELEISRVEIQGINEGHFIVSRNRKIIYDSMRYNEKNKKLNFVSKRIFRLGGKKYEF